ncbi:hypothetical protein MZM54_00145 [[Brevibacterium] frigoritolerans]|nr:hypothetical protein [Peribacillus frigoritolerans]
MKKSVFLLVFTMVFILSGCGFTTENFDEVIKEASDSKELSKYLLSIDYKLIESSEPGDDKEYYWYDITGKLDNNFDKLSKKDQHQFFKVIFNIVQKNGGTPSEEGEFYCGKDVECQIGHIDLKTSKHIYGVEYSNNYSSPSLLFIDNEIVYDEDAKDGVYVDPLKKHKTSAADDEKTSVVDDENSDLGTANGSDWVEYDEDHKYYMVNKALKNISYGGRMSVEFDIDWFIEALDSYYGNGDSEEADDLIVEILSMSGVAGGLIKEKQP